MQLSLPSSSYLAYFCEYTIILLWTLCEMGLWSIGLAAKGHDTSSSPPTASNGAFVPFTVTLAGDFGSICMDELGLALLHGSQRQTMFY